MTATKNQTSWARLAPLRRDSGAYAMLAVDQREALRHMMAQHRPGTVTDRDLQDFKLSAARILTPLASGVLIDRQFALDAALDRGVVDEQCGVIGSADHFQPAHGELVGRVSIDRDIDPGSLRDRGVCALKLLVLYRPDQAPGDRVQMVEEFIGMCHEAELASIIEPVSRAPVSGGDWDWNAGVLAAAEELGGLGADLYKAEVPHRGQASEAELRDSCRALSSVVGGEWVVLSSGVDAGVFPEAVRIACEEGASGFLAGRAVWAASLAAEDVEQDLRSNAVDRLQHLVSVVDDSVGGR